MNFNQCCQCNQVYDYNVFDCCENQYPPQPKCKCKCPTGPTGAVGVTGATGTQGNPGPTGATGPQGIQGPTGAIADGSAIVYENSQTPYYLHGQIIDYNGSFYMVSVDNPQGTPGSSSDFIPVNLSPNVGVTGATGPMGPQGLQGMPGAAGPAGPQGPQGIAGTVGTIVGAYNTLADLEAAVPVGTPGSFYYVNPNLYVWNVPSNSWINIGDIAGPQGVTGPAGPAGSGGSQGPVGAVGPQGPTGIQGPAGPAGSPGPTGIQGPAGVQGQPGGPGPAGPQGIQGVAGTVGTIVGAYDTLAELQAGVPVGTPGDFYYVSPDLYIWNTVTSSWDDVGPIAGPQGIQGVQGIQGNPGTTGPQGPAGPQGNPGSAGPAGAQGPAGPAGPAGPQGVAGQIGATGPAGAVGPAGAQGPQGVPGPAGPQGPAGTLSVPGGTVGGVLYVAPDGTIQADPNFTYSSTAVKAGLSGVLSVNNANIPGGIDPMYIQLTHQSANPYPAGSGVLWVDNSDQLWVDNNLISGSGGGGGGAGPQGPTGPAGPVGATGSTGLINGMSLATVAAGTTSAPLVYPSTLTINTPSTANTISGPTPASSSGFTTPGITSSVAAGPTVTMDATSLATQVSQNTVDISYLQNFTPGATSTGVPTSTNTYTPTLLDAFTSSERFSYSSAPIPTGELFFGQAVYRVYYCFSFSATTNEEYYTYFPSCQTAEVSFTSLGPPTAPSGSITATTVVRFGGSMMTGDGKEQLAIPATYYSTSNYLWCYVCINPDGTLSFHSCSPYSRTTSDYVYLWIDYTTT